MLPLPESHVAFHLLKACLGDCKINYLIFVTTLACPGSEALLSGRMMRSALRTIVGGPSDSAIFVELQSVQFLHLATDFGRNRTEVGKPTVSDERLGRSRRGALKINKALKPIQHNRLA